MGDFSAIQLLLDNGNEAMKNEFFDEALEAYKEALDISSGVQPTALIELYTNITKCYIYLKNYEVALQYNDTCLRIDPGLSSALVRRLYCIVNMLYFDEAKEMVKAMDNEISTEMCNMILHFNKVRSLWNSGNIEYNEMRYETCILYMENMLNSGVRAAPCILLKAECMARLGKIEEAHKIATTEMIRNPAICYAYYVIGLTQFMNGNFDDAISHLSHALSISRNDPKSVKEILIVKTIAPLMKEAKSSMAIRNYQKACEILTNLLDIYQEKTYFRATLLIERAMAKRELKKHYDAIEDNNKAICIITLSDKAFFQCALCYLDMGVMEEAEEYAQRAFDINNSDLNKNLLGDIMRTKSTKKKNYYLILGLPVHATQSEILKASRNLSRIFHPDRQNRELAIYMDTTQRFKDIQEAKNSLLADASTNALIP